ncbi:hypothetical protein E4H12_15890 [Candidatus Thorarchaeota archaeon]|nr:MAG: hypothetical protein E4H12_15890 [Candidatus Thorarchaeota archaeon]
MELDRAKQLAGITEQTHFRDAGEMLQRLITDIRFVRDHWAQNRDKPGFSGAAQYGGDENNIIDDFVSDIDDMLRKYAKAEVTPRR